MAAPTLSPFVSAPSPAVSAPPVADRGWFEWNIARGAAGWSDSVYRLHGYEPGGVVPSSSRMFSHLHPDDLYGCLDALHAGMVTARLVVHEHRLLDASGQSRSVVMIGRPTTDSQGRSVGIRGFLLPLYPGSRAAAGEEPGYREASLRAIFRSSFGVSERVARVLYAARRPLTARRDRHQQDFAHRYASDDYLHDLRRTLEDSLFPAAHFDREPLGRAA